MAEMYLHFLRNFLFDYKYLVVAVKDLAWKFTVKIIYNTIVSVFICPNAQTRVNSVNNFNEYNTIVNTNIYIYVVWINNRIRIFLF